MAHAGSNDLFLRGGKVGDTEPIVKDLETMVNAVAEKTDRGLVIGMLPRQYVKHYSLSKALGINERIMKYCEGSKVAFLDLWDSFMGKWHYFKKDGIQLNEIGQRKLGEILNKECERLMNKLKASSEESSSRVQVLLEGEAPLVMEESNSESHEGSFIGFTKEN